jgi:hypothetical protein
LTDFTGRLAMIGVCDSYPQSPPENGGPGTSVETRNLGGITTWSLRDNDLVLSGDQRVPVIRFTWLPDRGVFRHCSTSSRVALYVIFPEEIKDPLSIGCDDVPAAVLELRITPDKAAYQPGERIVITATLTNVGNAPIIVRRSDDETGRSDGFRVELSKDGANAQPTAPAPPSGNLGVAESLPPGGTNSRKLLLNRLVGSLTPGKYELRVIYTASYADADIGIWSDPIALEITLRRGGGVLCIGSSPDWLKNRGILSATNRPPCEQGLA